jgi:hypothetical protein
MALAHSPSIVMNGLVLALDAANTKSYDGSENLVSYSSYNASTWSNIFPANATLTTGITAPDGTNTAVRLTCTATGNSLLRVSFPGFTPNGTDTYTTSFYVKLISGTTSSSSQLTTDLADGNPTGNYLPNLITNQWVRVSFSEVPTATTKSFIDLLSDNTNNYVLDFWGVQVEKGSSANTYYPTTGTTKTRGTTWTDLSGNSNTGTLTNGPTYSSANGGSIVFDGTNDYIDLSNRSLPLINVSKFTYSTFIKITSSAALGMFFTFGNSSNYANDITFYYSSNTLYFQINNGGDGAGYFTYTIGSWSNISVVYDGTQSTNDTRLKVYINGVQQTLTFNYTVPATTSSTNFTGAAIGIYSTSGFTTDTVMGGNVGTASMYNRALSASEISQNFNALRGRYGI